ncbi:MAG TPA: hypothetical protein VI300_01975 [Solirubrobacter sp.]
MKRISGLVLLAFCLLMAPASADEARLWACHGPDGAPLGLGASAVDGQSTGGSCAAPGSAFTLQFPSATPQGLTGPSLRLAVPPGVDLTAVRLDRAARGPGYYASADTATLESETAGQLLDDVTTLQASPAGAVKLGLRCDAPVDASCAGAGAAKLDLRSAALIVDDKSAPVAAVGGLRNPASSGLDLDVQAADEGLGLAFATAWLDDELVAGEDFPGCWDLTPDDDTVDLALGDQCTLTGRVKVPVDLSAVAAGEHWLTVGVTDLTGNTSWTPEFAVRVEHPTTTGMDTLVIGNPTPAPTPAPGPISARPLPVPSAAPVAAPKPVAPKTSALVRLPKRVSRTGAYSVSVLCPASASKPCAHRLTLTAGGKTIATGRGSSTPGKRATIVMHLSNAARRALARKGTLTATLTLSGAAPTTVRLRG